jgi:hypothetical protein
VRHHVNLSNFGIMQVELKLRASIMLQNDDRQLLSLEQALTNV